MRIIPTVSRVNERLMTVQPEDDDAVCLGRFNPWNPFHLVGYLLSLVPLSSTRQNSWWTTNDLPFGLEAPQPWENESDDDLSTPTTTDS